MSVDETVPQTAPVELEREPARVSAIVSVFAGLIAMLMSALLLGLAIPFGIAGVLFLATGLFVVGSRRWVSLGVTSLFVSILLVGAVGAATPLALVASATAAFVSWDVGQYSITIGEQFGRSVPTRRAEMVHAASSSLIGVVAAALSVGIYEFGTGDKPAVAVMLLLLGVVGVIWALRD